MYRGCQSGEYLAFERYRLSSCQLELPTMSTRRQVRAIGPAPSDSPRSKASRNMAKFSETRDAPRSPARRARPATRNSMRPFSAVGSRRMRSSEMPLRPQGTNDRKPRTLSSPS